MASHHVKKIRKLAPEHKLWAREANTYKVIGTENLYTDYFEVNRYSLQHQKFNGSWTPTITREVFERGHAVCVLPYDPVRDELVFIEQFRAGAMVAGWYPWLMETAAGIIEAGETPEDVARRETLEETGLQVQRLEFIAHSLCTPGGSSETVALYCAEVNAENHPETAGLDAEHEDIRVFHLPAKEAIDLLQKKTVDTASTLICLQWFALNRDRLRKEWLKDSR